MKFLQHAVAIAAICGFSTIVTACGFSTNVMAEDLHFKLLNDASVEVISFQTSPVYQNDWGSNQMAGYELSPYGEVSVSIEDEVGVCSYDILVKFVDGTEVDDRNVDLCGLGFYTVED